MGHRERVRRDIYLTLMDVMIELVEKRELIDEEKRQIKRLRDELGRREGIFRGGTD